MQRTRPMKNSPLNEWFYFASHCVRSSRHVFTQLDSLRLFSTEMVPSDFVFVGVVPR